MTKLGVSATTRASFYLYSIPERSTASWTGSTRSRIARVSRVRNLISCTGRSSSTTTRTRGTTGCSTPRTRGPRPEPALWGRGGALGPAHGRRRDRGGRLRRAWLRDQPGRHLDAHGPREGRTAQEVAAMPKEELLELGIPDPGTARCAILGLGVLKLALHKAKGTPLPEVVRRSATSSSTSCRRGGDRGRAARRAPARDDAPGAGGHSYDRRLQLRRQAPCDRGPVLARRRPTLRGRVGAGPLRRRAHGTDRASTSRPGSMTLPAFEPVPVFPVTVRDGMVVVDVEGYEPRETAQWPRGRLRASPPWAGLARAVSVPAVVSECRTSASSPFSHASRRRTGPSARPGCRQRSGARARWGRSLPVRARGVAGGCRGARDRWLARLLGDLAPAGARMLEGGSSRSR